MTGEQVNRTAVLVYRAAAQDVGQPAATLVNCGVLGELPEEERWTEMEYQEFLVARRKLMAQVTREGFRKLSDPNYQPQSPARATVSLAEQPLPSFGELVQAEFIPAGTYLTPADGEKDSIAEVTQDGMILLDDVEYRTPDLAAHADGADDADGWDYWSVELEEPVLLSELRARGGESVLT